MPPRIDAPEEDAMTTRVSDGAERNARRMWCGLALVLLAVACQSAVAWAHGGGGGHGGGGFHGGGGGGGFGGGGRDFGGGGRDFGGGGRDFGGGGRDFGGGERDFGEAGRDLNAGRDFGGAGRGIEGGPRLDGGDSLDGRAGVRDFGGGHFAGAGDLSRADFQRIADRTGVAGGGRAVRPYSRDALVNRGDAIRSNFYSGGWYGGRGWYDQHFNRWWPGGWWGGYGWGMGAGVLTGLAWGELANWGGYAAVPVAYDYGSNVCYGDDGVSVGGGVVATAAEYGQQAATLASGGADAAIAADDQWRPLGVFALARQEETTPGTFLSLAIDKAGLLRGSYYDAVSDTTMNVVGKVDKQTQRAAWTVGDKKSPVYEAGLSNLTKQQTTILVHRDGGKVEQMLLVRVEDGRDGLDGGQAASDAARKPSPGDLKINAAGDVIGGREP
jgi:hypothetical protein